MGRFLILILAGALQSAPVAAQDCVVDADGDGYVSAADCPVNGTDCDDNDATVHPFAAEIPNDGIDQDCDGLEFETNCDLDGDGYDARACNGLDCNDQNAEIHPGAQEFDNDGIDQDCNGYDDCPPYEWVQGGLPRCAHGPDAPSGLAAALGALGLTLLARRRGASERSA
ncbi:MAG: putative metal-binding motif-containing protein [Alphaproteobacteria bacterium]|nr:putative metal-binding motif-containing protein [Alphaproteobacteria bacterium]